MQKIRMDIVPGHNIRRIRMAQSRRQWEVALQLQLMGCDLSRSDYAKIESGLRNISIQELRCIRNILNTTYDEILEGDADPPQKRASSL